MSDTLGSLVDKLSIVNIKMFMVQDKVHHAAAHGLGLDPETTSQLVSLNLQRTNLINELNEHDDAVTEPIIKVMDAKMPEVR